ncbi:hypothetical protein CK203_030673 [Vitis vinifera]|uniref:Uncharacterized protein n=1 Tax=Vitis vinifera TaxID=29760 RepID=A0A438IRP1_VITVI|nr:hypothetical protein CK203_030673 [Vitis vinifera]
MSAGSLSKKCEEPVAAGNLNTRYGLVHDETFDVCLGYNGTSDASIDCKSYNEETAVPVLETIFSPAFHMSKSAGGEIASGGSQKLPSDATSMNSSCNVDLEGNNLSSEVSAIYLAMKNSKLECVDEHGQDSMSTDGCVEDDDSEEFDDFDPYLFIKNLPDLSSVVPTFRPCCFLNRRGVVLQLL